MRVTGSSARAAVEAGDAFAPAVQPRLLGGEVAGIVDDVVDDPAEGIDRIHGVAPVRLQHRHAAVEAGAGLADLGGNLVEIGRVGAEGGAHRAPRKRSAPNMLAATSPRVSFTRVAIGSPRRRRAARRCDRPTITAVSSRSRRSRVPARQCPGGAVEVVATIQQGAEHLAHAGGFGGAVQIGDAGAETLHQILGKVAAVERIEVLSAVLQMVQHLQHGAERVGSRPGVAGFAVQIKHVAPDRHCRIAAVVEQFVPVGVAQLGGVAAEGDQQLAGMGGRHAGCGQAGAQAGGARGTGLSLAQQHRLHDVEPAHLVAGGRARRCRRCRRRCGRRRRRRGHAARSRGAISAEPTGKFSSPRSLPDQVLDRFEGGGTHDRPPA